MFLSSRFSIKLRVLVYCFSTSDSSIPPSLKKSIATISSLICVSISLKEFVHSFNLDMCFNCFSASCGLSQKSGACVFSSSSSIRINLFAMSKIPPQRILALFKVF
jgi:hypothetical protein